MFYAHFVLAKKGPLARIWLAAHWDKKLTKAHVFETNIESSVEGILQPKVKLALRTSGHLLLGIVRIYSRKAKYLLADCNEAFIKIKMAFRPGVVDLPEENREAAVATITLPEVFHDFDTAMPDIGNIDVDTPVTLNQSRAEDITLKEDYGNLSLMGDDGFGDMSFDDPEMARDATNIDEGFDHASLLLGQEQEKDKDETTLGEPSSSSSQQNKDISDSSVREEGFGAPVEDGLLGNEGGLFSTGGLFDDAPLTHVPLDTSTQATNSETVQNQEPLPQRTPLPGREDSEDEDMYDMGPPSMGAPSGPSSPGSVAAPDEDLGGTTPRTDGPNPLMLPQDPMAPLDLALDHPVGLSHDNAGSSHLPADQTTLIQNEEETFALAPLDANLPFGAEKSKAKRKRKLIVDEVKNISGEEMKSQLSDTTDITTTLDLAPPTKRLMHWKETGGVEKLFALPGKPMISKNLCRLYTRHLTTRSVETDDPTATEEDRIELEDEFQEQSGNREEDFIPHHPRKRARREPQHMIEEDLSSRLGDPHQHQFPQHSHHHLHHHHHHQQQQQQGEMNGHPFLALQEPLRHLPMEQHMPMMDGSPHHHNQQHHHHHHQHHMPMQSPHHPRHHDSYMYPQTPEPPTQQPLSQLAHPLPQLAHPLPQLAHPMPQLAHPLPQLAHPIAQLAHPLPHLPQQFSQLQQPLPQLQQPLPQIQQQLPPQMQLQQPMAQLSQMEERALGMDSPLHHHPQQMGGMVNSMAPPLAHLPHPLTAPSMPPPQSPAGMMEQSPAPVSNQQEPLPLQVGGVPYSPYEHVPEAAQTEAQDAFQDLSHSNHNVQQQEQLQEVHHHHQQEELPLENQAPSGEAEPEPQPMAPEQVEELESRLEEQMEPEEQDMQPQQQEQQQEPPPQQQQQELLPEDDDDYGGPASVGVPEEQLADETYEQFEERILNRRTMHMLHLIQRNLDRGESMLFSDVAHSCNRKQAAQKFYTFLVLKKQQVVELQQGEAYGEIIITKGPKYSSVY